MDSAKFDFKKKKIIGLTEEITIIGENSSKTILAKHFSFFQKRKIVFHSKFFYFFYFFWVFIFNPLKEGFNFLFCFCFR